MAAVSDTFRDLGADNIIFGGQTMNPSTQDIIDGINMTPAETVFILPNNKNIYLVACEAAKIVTDKNVIVLSTKSVPQGIAAMIAFDESLSLEENLGNMNRAIAGVKSMSVTQSVRDTTLAGEKISNGQLLGIIDGNIQCVADTNEDCIGKLAENMKQASFVTIFYGSDVTETEAGRALDIVKSKVDTNAEINLLSGGQPIYNYIISVENISCLGTNSDSLAHAAAKLFCRGSLILFEIHDSSYKNRKVCGIVKDYIQKRTIQN